MLEAVRQAVATHPRVSAANYELQAAQSNTTAGKFRWFPVLQIDNQNAKKSDRYPNGAYTTTALKQTLWDFGRIEADNDATLARESAAVAALGGTHDEIAFRAAMAWSSLVRARQLRAVAETNLKDHLAAHQSISRRAEGGLGTRSEVSMAASRLQQARAAVHQWEAEIARAEANYVAVIGMPPAAELVSLDPGNRIPLLNTILDEAKAYSPQLQKLRADAEVAEAETRSSRAQIFPRLYGRMARTDYHNSSTSAIYGGEWQFTVNAEWQSDVGISQRYRVESAERQSQAAQEAVISAERDLVEQVSATWHDYNTALNRAVELKGFASAATETVDQFRRQFNLGRRSWPEVMNALSDVYTARLQVTEAEFNAVTARIRLAVTAGEMSALLRDKAGEKTGERNGEKASMPSLTTPSTKPSAAPQTESQQYQPQQQPLVAPDTDAAPSAVPQSASQQAAEPTTSHPLPIPEPDPSEPEKSSAPKNQVPAKESPDPNPLKLETTEPPIPGEPIREPSREPSSEPPGPHEQTAPSPSATLPPPIFEGMPPTEPRSESAPPGNRLHNISYTLSAMPLGNSEEHHSDR